MDDRALLEACLRMDPAAWETLCERHRAGMLRAAASRLPSPATSDAQDAVQQVLSRLASDGGRALSSFEGRSSLATWLRALALREASEMLRSRRGVPRGFAREDEIPSPIHDLVRSEEAGRLREAMGSLPARERLLLRLAYWDRLPYREIARVLGVAEGSVSPLLQRARASLRKSEILRTSG